MLYSYNEGTNIFIFGFMYLEYIYLSSSLDFFIHLMLEYLQWLPFFSYWTFSQGNVLPLSNVQSSVTKIQVWQNDLYFVLNFFPIPETFKLLDVLILTGLYYRNNVNFFRN